MGGIAGGGGLPPMPPGNFNQAATKVIFVATISSSRRRMLSAVNITDLEVKTRAGVSCVSPICEVVVTLDSITHPQQITFTITDRSETNHQAIGTRTQAFVAQGATQLSSLFGITITAPTITIQETITL